MKLASPHGTHPREPREQGDVSHSPTRQVRAPHFRVLVFTKIVYGIDSVFLQIRKVVEKDMYMACRIRFEERVASMCECYELLEGVSPLHTFHRVRSRCEHSHIRLTARPAADGSLAARSTIALTYFSCPCTPEEAMLDVCSGTSSR